MNELRSIKTYLTTLSLNDQPKFRLDKIIKIKDYSSLKLEKEKQ